MQTILITGGLGFIGSNFIEYFLEKNLNYQVVNLDIHTYAGDLSNVKNIAGDKRYTYIKGNICDRKIVEEIFISYDIKGVIHFAAESHVDNSIKKPDIFIETNVKGTYTLLDVAQKFWMDAPFVYKKGYETSTFLHVSTDEVYGTLGKTGLFTEKTPYAPNSPYSASKASSDMVARSYYHTFGLHVVITNCSNNYGPHQHDEKLIPTIIRKALNNESIPIYGDGENIRDWLYVLDHCKGVELAFHSGVAGENYNIGGNNEKTNNYIAYIVCEILDELRPKNGSYKELISYVDDRPGHDKRYAIDASKIEKKLGWKASENFESGILKTIQWYITKYSK